MRLFIVLSRPLRRSARPALLLLSTVLPGNAAFPVQANPGALFEQRRAAIVAKFDRNGDGRLDDTEREAARLAKKQDALRPQRNPMFQMPPEIVKQYDQDGDGELNEAESAAASEGIRIRWAEVQKEYDRDGDGNLNDGERERLGTDISAGKVAGLPRSFGTMMRGPRGGGRGGGMFGGGRPAENPLAQFDADKDGRLNEAELEAARRAGAGRPAGR